MGKEGDARPYFWGTIVSCWVVGKGIPGYCLFGMWILIACLLPNAWLHNCGYIGSTSWTQWVKKKEGQGINQKRTWIWEGDVLGLGEIRGRTEMVDIGEMRSLCSEASTTGNRNARLGGLYLQMEGYITCLLSRSLGSDLIKSLVTFGMSVRLRPYQILP